MKANRLTDNARYTWTRSVVLLGWGLLASAATAHAEDYFRPQLVLDSKGLLGNPITSVDISNDGNWLAASSGKEVLIWNRTTKQHFVTLRGYQEPGGFRVGTVNRVRFLPDNRHLAVAVSDNSQFGSTRLYDLADPLAIKQMLKAHVGCTKQLAVSPGGKYLVTSGCDGMFYVSGFAAEQQEWLPLMQFRQANNQAARASVQWTDYPQAAEFAYEVYTFPWNDDWFLWGKQRRGSLLSLDAKAFLQFPDWPAPMEQLVTLPANLRAPFPGRTTFGVVDLAYDRAAWALVSGFSRQPEATTYWVAAWRDDQLVSTYPHHRERPTAVKLNLEAGLAVSGDAFGEVHVWNLQNPDGPRETYGVGNRRLYRVAWTEAGTGLRFADSYYAQGEYTFNRLGRLTRVFPLFDRGIREAAEAEVVAESSDPTQLELQTVKSDDLVAVRSQRLNGQTAWELVAIDASGATRSLHPLSIPRFPAYRIPPGQLITKAFGDVWAYCEVPLEQRLSADPELFIGTERGTLVQASISHLPNLPAPCLVIRRNFVGHSARVTSLDVSPDGRYLASSSWDGTLRVWDLEHHEQVPDVDFHTEGSRVVDVPVGSRARSAGLRTGDAIVQMNGFSYYARHRRALDGEFGIGDIVTIEYRRDDRDGQAKVKLVPGVEYSEPAMSVFLAADGEWVAWTPEGFYDASAGGERYIGWHINRARYEPALFHDVGQYREELYRPDILNAAFAPEAAPPAVQLPTEPAKPPQILVTENFAEVEPPSVTILSPQDNATVTDAQVKLVVGVAYRNERSQAIKQLNVQVNGSPAELPQRQSSLLEGDVHNDIFEVTVPLFEPANTIAVQATNYQDVSSPLRQITVRRVEATTPPGTPQTTAAPDLYILAVGISKYRDPVWALSYAAKDAEDFAAAFQRQTAFYGRIECKVITDEEATVRGIKEGMAWLQQKVQQPQDYAFVFLAGHGLFDPSDTWYFGTVDLDPAQLFATGISQAEVQQFMEQQVGGRAVLFADTCHAAQAVNKRGMPVRKVHSQGINPWRSLDKLALLSCLPHQESREGPRWQNGVFTHCLVRSLECAECDVDRDGSISFDELALFVKADVLRETIQQQEPTEVKNVPTGVLRLGSATRP